MIVNALPNSRSLHMMNKLDIFKGFLRGKRIAVLGIGISNRPLIRYISDLGGHITAFDKLPAGDPVLRETRVFNS